MNALVNAVEPAGASANSITGIGFGKLFDSDNMMPQTDCGGHVQLPD